MPERRILEPRDILDRMVYLGLVITGPRTAIVCFRAAREDLDIAGMVLAVFSAVATYYTVDWAVKSYRRWLARKQ